MTTDTITIPKNLARLNFGALAADYLDHLEAVRIEYSTVIDAVSAKMDADDVYAWNDFMIDALADVKYHLLAQAFPATTTPAPHLCQAVDQWFHDSVQKAGRSMVLASIIADKGHEYLETNMGLRPRSADPRP